MKIRLRTVALVLLALVLLGALAATLVVRLGVYDVAATRQHTTPVYKLLDFAMRRAVEASADTPPPADLGERRRVLAGAVHYREHCLQCHGAPGVAPGPLAFGLTPAPTNLVPAGRGWDAPELFWVVKNGIKSSGMPAWIYRLSDEQIWDVVAFLRAMPYMTVPEYAQLPGSTPPPRTPPHPRTQALRPGDVEAGRLATARYLCATCHRIPGFVSATSHVGPPLEGAGTRAFIAGVLPNSRENMVRWLMDPHAIDPLSAMPPLGVTEQDAHDIAAFMASLDVVKGR